MDNSAKWSRFKLPLLVFGMFLVLAAWVAFGRVLFGVLGWMVLVTLFLFGPMIAVYGLTLAIIVAVRQRNYVYRKWGPFMTSLIITAAALFCVGFFLPDGGDTKDSIGSAMSTLMMDRTNPALIGVSGTLAAWSIFATIISSIVTFVLAFIERPRRPTGASHTSTLKPSK